MQKQVLATVQVVQFCATTKEADLLRDEITVSLANESIQSLEIESTRTREMDLGTNFPAFHPAFKFHVGNIEFRAFNVCKCKSVKFSQPQNKSNFHPQNNITKDQPTTKKKETGRRKSG